MTRASKTGGPSNRDPAESQLWLSEIIQNYLTAISEKVPDPTYRSHKNGLNDFKNWTRSRTIHSNSMEDSAANFINHLWGGSSYSVDTIRGYVFTLSNLIAFLHQDDPEIISAHILRGLQEKQETDIEELCEQVFKGFKTAPQSSDPSKQEIEEIISHLRQSQFGSRTHVYIETILEAKARPSKVQQLNLSSFDEAKNCLKIGITERYLIGKFNVVTSREIRLPDKTKEALQEYIEFNRTPVVENGSSPLFTTHQGRANPSTLRRSVTQVSEKLATNKQAICTSDSGSATTCPTNEGHRAVRPSDIWWYAITGMIE